MVSNTIGCKVVRVRVSLPAQKRGSPGIIGATHVVFQGIKYISMIRPVVFLFLLLLANSTSAQQPAQDLRPHLRTLSTAQKLKLLGYMRTQGSELDQELQDAYRHLPAAGQEKTLQYISVLNNEGVNAPRTTVEWDKDSLFFGKVESGYIVFDSFTVKNTGKSPYVISEIKTACNCVVVARPEYPVMPGESAVIRIKFDSIGRVGTMVAGIVVYDNSRPNLRSIMYLCGEVLPRKTQTGGGG